MAKQTDNEFKHAVIKVSSADSFLNKSEESFTPNGKEYTYRQLPPGKKLMIQESTVEVLREMRVQLKEFTTFVEDLQNKTPEQLERLSVTPLAENSRYSDPSNLRPVHVLDSRPRNAPLRDAFHMIRNFLWRISNVVDQVSSEIPAYDKEYSDVHSPHFESYYTQYVLQLAFYVLKMVGEQLDKFSKILGELAVDDTLDELPDSDDDVISKPTNIFQRKQQEQKISEVIDALANLEENPKSPAASLDKILKLSNDSQPEDKLKDCTSDAFDLLISLSNRLLSYFQEKGLGKLDKIQQQEFSRKALSTDLCKQCSQKIARRLRRYSSRENLHVEKFDMFEKESDEIPPSSKEIHPNAKERRVSSLRRESVFKSGDKQKDFILSTMSKAYMTPVSSLRSECRIQKSEKVPLCRVLSEGKEAEPPFWGKIGSPRENISLEQYQKEKDDPSKNLFKSASHREPLMSRNRESSTSNQVFPPKNMWNGKWNFLTLPDESKDSVPKDPGIGEKINLTEEAKFNDNINFDLPEFCVLLKENFRKLLSEDDGIGSTDTCLIVNVLIHCFQEASRNAAPTHVQFQGQSSMPPPVWRKTSGESANDADVENNVSDSATGLTEDASTVEEHETQLDNLMEEFVNRSLKTAVQSLERKGGKRSIAAKSDSADSVLGSSVQKDANKNTSQEAEDASKKKTPDTSN